MIAVWIILGIVAYLIIGGIIAGFVNDEDLDADLIGAWPILCLCIPVYYIVEGVKRLGYTIANRIRKLITYIKK
jgi:hypothetical protein